MALEEDNGKTKHHKVGIAAPKEPAPLQCPLGKWGQVGWGALQIKKDGLMAAAYLI